MRYAISFSGILLGMLEGKLNLDEIDAVLVGCVLGHATGALGIPVEASWGGEVIPKSDGKGLGWVEQKSLSGHPVKREDITSKRHWDNWVKVRDFLIKLEAEGRLASYKNGTENQVQIAKRLLAEGHTVWIKRYGWIDSEEAFA